MSCGLSGCTALTDVYLNPLHPPIASYRVRADFADETEEGVAGALEHAAGRVQLYLHGAYLILGRRTFDLDVDANDLTCSHPGVGYAVKVTQV